MGECIFGLFTAEGDSVCFSTGLLIHVGSIGSSIKWMLKNDWDEKVGIKEGDYFFNNDAFIAGAHTQDHVTCTPIFADGELIGWAGGLTHVPETGAVEPGGGGAAASSRYDEGICWPCIKVVENEEIKRDLEIIVERGTRFPLWWILDGRARIAGCRMIRDGVKALVEEYGKEYFMQATYEYIENTRKACSEKIKNVLFPGIYHGATFYSIPNADLPVRYPEDHLILIPIEVRVEPQGEIFLDLEGASPAGFHPNNSTYWCTQGILSDMMIQVLYYDIKYNQGLYQASLEPRNLHIPASIFNPPDHTYAVSQWASSQCLAGLLSLTVGRAYYSAGFREEVSSGSTGCTALNWAGTDQFGRPTTGTNFEAAATGMDASAVADGPDSCYSTFNPEGDMTDAEVWEKIMPLIYLSRKVQMDGGGFGKYRGGSGIHSLFVVENTDNLDVGAVASPGEVFVTQGSMGGYPGATNYKHVYADTNFHELLKNKKPIPFFEGDDPERPDYTRMMKGKLIRLPGQHPVYLRKRGDLVSQFSLSGGGFGDPIDRNPEDVARDLAFQVTSRRAAEKVHGVIVSENGEVDEEKTRKLREKIRAARKNRGIPAKEYIRQYQEKILKGELPANPKKSLNLGMRNSEKFYKEFISFWGLEEDFKQIP